MAQLYEYYKKDVVEKLLKDGRYTNRMQVPKVEKVVVNMGVNANHDKDVINEAQQELATITGQKALVTNAKKSISNFKVRQGMPVGAKVTLRGLRMYEFLERFFNAALPRIRDFRGVNPRGFDGRGSYTMGVKDAFHGEQRRVRLLRPCACRGRSRCCPDGRAWHCPGEPGHQAV